MGISCSKVTCYRLDFTGGVPNEKEFQEWHFKFLCLECVYPKRDIVQSYSSASWKVQEWINRHQTNFEKGDYGRRTRESKHVGKYNTIADPRKPNSPAYAVRAYPSAYITGGQDDEIYEERGRGPNLKPFMYRFRDEGDNFELEKIKRTHEWVSNHQTILGTQNYDQERIKNTVVTGDIAAPVLVNKLNTRQTKGQGRDRYIMKKKKTDGRGK